MYGDRNPEELLNKLRANNLDIKTDNLATFIEDTRVLSVVHSISGMPVDIVFGGPCREEEFVQLARQSDYLDLDLIYTLLRRFEAALDRICLIPALEGLVLANN